ncbi:putative protein phosphatase 2C-like protein 44 [Rhododendron vialii]|uniref:putative protein phosphatase 2C-like protein 44 n=1 Tax=Rhododendron vialii TaxID=182163 RepID=UPI0026601A2F|nr:putative protein phosphatase 2C-like protein 44 [Rhododendron vialii]
MGFKDFHHKLKVSLLRKLFVGDAGKKKREAEFGKRPSWMVPVSHGYHVVEDRSFAGESNGESDSVPDSVVVQREQIGELEVWFFGVFSGRMGDCVAKSMQSHLFDKKPKESQLKRKSKEAMRKAYVGARGKMKERAEEKGKRKEKGKVGGCGSASAIVINGEKLVMANMGGYRAVVCRDGEAHQINRTRQNQGTPRRHWSRKLIPGVIRMPKVRILVHESGAAVGTDKANPKCSAEIVVGDESIDSDTEFVILASTGIWEVMKHQEAVNLIRHIEDPQEAAECLAREALTRMSKSNISCLVIRFE